PVRSQNEYIVPLPSEAKAPVVLLLAPREDAATQVDTAAYNAMRHAYQHRGSADKRYCLVVASMATENEAKRYLAKHADIELGVLNKDGRYRVYAVEGSTISEVNRLAESSQLDKRFPSSWVCRK
ncbi:MAG: SPOR domain-containing protein, partial [Muribaculaceae bacterium]|nr:SPOR domain-containing protein [Muribaculaceae bacterium]